ncbi:MAG: hypothetical protein WA977_08025, partial [Halobacteriota archaeon]
QIDAIDAAVSEINVKTVLILPPGCTKETDRPGALDPEKYYNVITAQIAGGSNIPISIKKKMSLLLLRRDKLLILRLRLHLSSGFCHNLDC